MSVKKEEEINLTGRVWNSHSMHDTYQQASAAKTKFLERNEKMQAKIKRKNSNNKFLLKTRLLAEFVKEEKKKRGKNKRRNKKAASRREVDTPSAI